MEYNKIINDIFKSMTISGKAIVKNSSNQDITNQI